MFLLPCIFNPYKNYRNMIKKMVYILVCILAGIHAEAQKSIVGKWKIIQLIQHGETINTNKASMKEWAIADYKKRNPSKKITAADMKKLDIVLNTQLAEMQKMIIAFNTNGSYETNIAGKKVVGTYEVVWDTHILKLTPAGRVMKETEFTLEKGVLTLIKFKGDMSMVWKKI